MNLPTQTARVRAAALLVLAVTAIGAAACSAAPHAASPAHSSNSSHSGDSTGGQTGGSGNTSGTAGSGSGGSSSGTTLSSPGGSGSSGSGTGGTPTGTAATSQMVVRPWTASGALQVWTGDTPTSAIPLGAPASGNCFGSSIALQVPDAWRCTVGANELVDPCLSDPSGAAGSSEVLCFPSPWADAIPLRLASAVPIGFADKAGRTSDPWALELANGAKCLLSTGANTSADGVTLDYGCASGLAGGLETTSPAWTVMYQAKGATTLSSVAVTGSWTIATGAMPGICDDSQLAGTLYSAGAGAGSAFLALQLHNVSSTGCTISGQPVLHLLGASGAVLPTRSGPGTTEKLLTVAAGSSVYAGISYNPANLVGTEVPGVGCEKAYAIEVVIPEGGGSFVIHLDKPTPFCSNGSADVTDLSATNQLPTYGVAGD